MEKGIGKTWVLKFNGRVLGFISVAMAHMQKARTTYFEGKKSDSNIPALLIGHLATHKDALRRGIGKELVKWAIREAVNNSKRIGCRIVMLNPDDDQIVKSFYNALNFRYVDHSKKDKDVFYLDIQTTKK